MGLGVGVCALQAGTSFTNGASRTERELRPGEIVFGGLQIRAGSAALEAEVRYLQSSSRTRVFKDSSVLPIATLIGYRFSL